MSVRLSLKTGLAVSLQQVLFSQVLQASGAELEELVRHELEQNPALERIPRPKPASATWREMDSGLDQVPDRISSLQQLEAQILS